jgi:hypothetical protein
MDGRTALQYVEENKCRITVSNVQRKNHVSFLFSDPPEIDLETDRVHSGDNKEAHLTCLIHGNPTPKVKETLSAFYVLNYRRKVDF